MTLEELKHRSAGCSPSSLYRQDVTLLIKALEKSVEECWEIEWGGFNDPIPFDDEYKDKQITRLLNAK
jgi:hypothetical protein